MRNSLSFTFALALLVGGGASVRADDTPSEIDALKQRVAELEAQVARLVAVRSQAEAPATQAPVLPAESRETPPAPTVQAGPSGFSLTSADRSWRLRIRATAQADARFVHGGATDTFLLRRLCPSFEGSAGRFVGFKFMPDFAPSTPTVRDAYLDIDVTRGLQLRVGKSKVPFDFERLVSQSELLFVERAHPSSLGPDRDLGLLLQGNLADGRLSWAAGVFNGVPDGGSSSGDSDDTKDVAGRVFWRPWLDAKGAARPSGLGVAFTVGERGGIAPSGHRTLAQQSMFAFRSGVLADGTQWRVSPQACLYEGPLGLMASWTLSSQELALGGVRETMRNTAWQVAASWVLSGENAGPRGVKPTRPLDPATRGWGAFEVAARLSGLRIDEDAFSTFANPGSAVRRTVGGTLGLNWYWNDNVKAVANYEYATFSGGAADGQDRPDEHALLTRLQLRY